MISPVKTRLLGSSGLRVSDVALGVGTFGEPSDWGADRQESERIFDAYLEGGGSLFDTANTYAGGRSEEILGELARGRREELVIGTKFAAITRDGDQNAWGSHRKNLRQALDASLRRLGTDYVDILWVHAWDLLTPLNEMMRALDDEVRSGRVLYIGVSNTPAWAVARANTLAELRGWTSFVGLQTEYNLMTRTSELELFPMCRSLGLGVLCWSPLGGGVLAGGYRGGSGVTGRRFEPTKVSERRLGVASEVARIASELGHPPAAVALSWLRKRPHPVIPILGARTEAQLRQNLELLDVEIGPEAMRTLDELSAPAPIMPAEFMDTEDAIDYFDGGLRRTLEIDKLHGRP